MELKAPVQASRGLPWAIRKATGLNLGGFVEAGGVPQTGSIQTSDEGTRLILPDSTPTATVAQLQAILAAHNPTAPLQADFPADPPPPVVNEKALWAAATAAEKLLMLARRAGLA